MYFVQHVINQTRKKKCMIRFCQVAASCKLLLKLHTATQESTGKEHPVIHGCDRNIKYGTKLRLE